MSNKKKSYRASIVALGKTSNTFHKKARELKVKYTYILLYCKKNVAKSVYWYYKKFCKKIEKYFHGLKIKFLPKKMTCSNTFSPHCSYLMSTCESVCMHFFLYKFSYSSISILLLPPSSILLVCKAYSMQLLDRCFSCIKGTIKVLLLFWSCYCKMLLFLGVT